jgi:cation:H+ antiporter
VVGSNIFNIFLILGAVGLIRPVFGPLEEYKWQLGFLAGVTILGVLFMRGSRRIVRAEGVLLMAGYVAFIVFMIVDAVSK